MKQEGRRGGLSLQAWLGKQQGRQEARHKAPFTLRCPPLLSLYRLHVSSARCTALSKDHLGGRWREILRPPLPTIMSFFVFCMRPSRRLHLTPSGRDSPETFWRRLIFKAPPRSVSVCLPPPLPSVPLTPLFRISLCIFHLLVVTLSNDSIYFRKQCPIYFKSRKEKKRKRKTFALLILSAISIFLLLVIFKGGRRQLFDNASSYLPNTKLKYTSLILSQLRATHLRKPPLFYLFFKSVHQPSFDPLECIKHSQIKRTWRRIHKQPHATFSLEMPPFSATLLSFWSIYCQTSVPFSCSRLIHFIFTLLLPTWDDCMTLDVLKFNNVYVCVSFLIKYYAICTIHFCIFWGKPEVGAGEGSGAFQRPGESSYQGGEKTDGKTARHWVASLTFMYYTYRSRGVSLIKQPFSNTVLGLSHDVFTD